MLNLKWFPLENVNCNVIVGDSHSVLISEHIECAAFWLQVQNKFVESTIYIFSSQLLSVLYSLYENK